MQDMVGWDMHHQWKATFAAATAAKNKLAVAEHKLESAWQQRIHAETDVLDAEQRLAEASANTQVPYFTKKQCK